MPKAPALITGASSGIGAELAALCAANGYPVILVARSTSQLEERAAQLSSAHGVRARVLPADLSDPEAPRAIFEQLRGELPELLINNAGFGVRGAFVETDWQQEASMMQVNMSAPVLLTKLFLPEMVRRGSGRILNVASTAGFVPGPFMALYYASKAFLVSFSHAIANEVQGTGVTVTVLCPGPTVTNFAAAAHAEDSALFRGPVMSAADVAREGFDAMMAGKPQVIAGARNRWMMRGARLLPMDRLAQTTRRLNTT